jgi:hypothetical protein
MAGGHGGREGGRERSREWGAVQPVFENRFNTFIGTGADGERAAAGGFKPFCPIAFPQSHDA